MVTIRKFVCAASMTIVMTFVRTVKAFGPAVSVKPFWSKSVVATTRFRQSHQPFATLCTSTTRLYSSTSSSSSMNDFFAPDGETFESMGVRSPILLERIKNGLKLDRPSAVQAAAYKAIVEGGDVTIGAETGSGKTLAYLLPLIDDILQLKSQMGDDQDEDDEDDDDQDDFLGYDYCRAVILVPNKELVNQVVRMATILCGGPQCVVSNRGSTPATAANTDPAQQPDERSLVRLAILPGGLKSPEDFRPFRESRGLGGGDEPPVDVIVTTPAALAPFGVKPKHIDMFADISTLVIDEADMLLDGGYIRPLEDVMIGFRRADKLDDSYRVGRTQNVFVAATLPDMGLRSVDAYLQKRFPYATRVTMAGMHNAKHYGLREPTVWIEQEENRERMIQLVQLLQTPPSSDKNGLAGEKVMVFLNSVTDVDGAYSALDRAGVKVVPYHAKIPLGERTKNLDKFRRYGAGDSDDDDDNAVPVLVCTDLASRGLDIPGVTVVVQLQFAGNVVAHLHRMGRCGRAGQRNGRGIVFYDSKQRDLIRVVQDAESQQEQMVLEGNDVMDPNNNDNNEEEAAKVKNAFSRRRGFTKKRKKLRKQEQEQQP